MSCCPDEQRAIDLQRVLNILCVLVERAETIDEQTRAELKFGLNTATASALRWRKELELHLGETA